MNATAGETGVFAVLRLAPDAAGLSELRRTVAGILSRWHREDLLDDAILCASELAGNAVLHTRRSYDLTLRPAGAGVRLEVVDNRPQEVPILVPANGSAADVTSLATTGRGLQIVARLASRWGFTTTQTAKSVWAEIAAAPGLDDGGREVRAARGRSLSPVVVVDQGDGAEPGPIKLWLRSMPVRLAIISGVQVDELVREIQLGPEGIVTPAELATLYDLLDRSSHPRLAGRYAALRAASANEDRFDLELETTLDALVATSEINRHLSDFSHRVHETLATVTPPVARFREWVLQEVTAQMAGQAPRRCTVMDQTTL
jgi:hypothetical protein